ncbi:multicopy suppressor of BFA (Brefeldin A) [Basidiobolus ranarum]|uniref:Multicopy suppressor of BFA (Brefeldin A) n=1 Tax=Basidiobolus ranarum TaxID=34480 RepID=A0ABR2X2D3_9FUNG
MMATNTTTQTQKRVSKPDQEVYRKNLDEIDASIEAVKEKLTLIKEKIGGADSKGPSGDRRSQLLDKLQEIRTQQAEIKKSKQSVRDQMNVFNANIRRKVGEMKDSKDKSPFKTLKEIETQIETLENQLESGSLKLIEEKRVVNEISNLKKSRKNAESFEAQQQSIDEDKKKIEELKVLLDDPKNKALNDEYNAIQAELDTLSKGRESERAKRNELFNERNKLQKELDAIYNNKRAVQDAYRNANNEYYKWQQEDRTRRQEQFRLKKQQEVEEKKAAIAAQERELAEVPAYLDEINSCDTLLNYLQQYSSDQSAAEKTEEVSAPSTLNIREPDTNNNVPEGFVLKKKSDDEYFVGGKASKKNKNKNKNEPKASTFKLPLSIMEQMWELKLDVPVSAGDADKSIVAIKEKKQWFKENQERVTAENKAKAEAKIAALNKNQETATEAVEATN